MGTRKNGRARRRHACLPRARPFSLSPATSKRLLRRLNLPYRWSCIHKQFTLGYCFVKAFFFVFAFEICVCHQSVKPFLTVVHPLLRKILDPPLGSENLTLKVNCALFQTYRNLKIVKSTLFKRVLAVLKFYSFEQRRFYSFQSNSKYLRCAENLIFISQVQN